MTEEMFEDDELAAANMKEGDAEPEAVTEPVAEPEVTPVVEPEVKTEAEPVTEGEKPKLVPHEALHAERMKSQAIKRELDDERAAREKDKARIDAIEAMLAPKPEPLPPIAENPIAHIQSLGQTTEQLRQMLEAQQQQTEAATQFRVVQSALERSEVEFRQTAPDYDAAADHLYNSRVAEMRMLGIQDAQIPNIITQEIHEMTRTAAMQGRSPAELFYEAAKLRGYRAGEAAAPVISPSAKVAAINNGQAQAKSLGGAQGGAVASDLNVKALLELSDEEFAKIDAAQFRRAAGG